ncbi:MAG: hypothetical protein HZC12_04655 [Nitrospirae bacterium]|nr:hypothetical protein [Nitrospirota bacterium]
MTKPKKKLGEVLMEAGLIDALQLNSALGHQKQWGGRLGSVVISLGFVDEEEMASVLEKQLNTPCIFLEDLEIPAEALKTVSIDTAKRYTVFPVKLEGKIIIIAMTDPTDAEIIDALQFTTGLKVKPALALESDIKRAIMKHYEGIVQESAYRVKVKRLREIIKGKSEPEVKPAVKTKTAELATESLKFSQPETEGDVYLKTILNVLISLLIEKGVITKAELIDNINKIKGKT